MSDFTTRITMLVDASAPPVDIDELAQHLDLSSGAPAAPPHLLQRRRASWVAALGTAIVVLLLVGGAGWLIGGTGSDVADEPMGTTIPTAIPTTAPSVAPPVTTDQTVSVTVSEVSGHDGDHLAVVLYRGGRLTDLDRDAVGGFWTLISGNNSTTTEVVRQPADPSVGRFPFVSEEALTVEPGEYTLVVWVDDALNPASRWVPINTDAMGLFGCQAVIEVGDDAQTDIAVSAHLQPDGWNTKCTSP